MKKLLPLLALVAAASCTPDIPQDPPPPASNAIVVEFDPGAVVPVVPLPNDLGIDPVTKKVKAPSLPTDSPAQTQFNTEYLDTLTGFPFESTASALVSGDLNVASVTAANVLVLDITDPTKPAPVTITPVYAPATKSISIAPPKGGWTRAHHYAVAFLGGPNGLRGAANEDVVGSPTWALVSAANPLVTCTDLTSPDCAPAVDIIPSTQTDPAARLADQTKTALQLEQIRRGYLPILSALDAQGHPRSTVPIVWTFGIVDAAEVTFDPADSIIPFPNDAVRTGAGGTVALPNPKTGAPLTAADCQTTDTSILLVCGLNTLDGFSTLVSPISENSDTLGALEQGSIDATSLSTTTVGLVPLASTAPTNEQTKPNFTPCLNCQSSAHADGSPQTSPQQLQWKLNAPLDEKTTYFGYVTGAVKDDKGIPVVPNPVFALLRSKTALVDGAGKATVNILTDAQAKQLEPLRAAFQPAFLGLEKAGLPRGSLALAFPFTTQSEASLLDQLYQVPATAAKAGLPDYPVNPTGLIDVTTPYKGALVAAAGGNAAAAAAIGKIYEGVMLTPVLVTGPGGTLNPTGAKPQLATFAVSIPATAAPAGGYPVTVFGHGFTRSRDDFLFIANALSAAGQVVIASDVLFHGERTSCTGSKAANGTATDDASCANPATMKCDEGTYTSTTNFGQGLCVLRDASPVDPTARVACAPSATDPTGDGACAVQGQGRCAADAKCQGAGADFLRALPPGAPVPTPASDLNKPLISGWNIFSLTNFFATRDNFRQQVVDLAQLTALLKSTANLNLANQIANKAGAAVSFDTTKINYAGQSLGGILGTLYNSVSPDTKNVVLNVPGGALVSIILNAPSFATQKAALLGTLAAQGLQPGTPAFDQFLGLAQWILDPADPANMGYRLTHSVDIGGGTLAPPASRKVFIQFIQGDETVPNVSNFALVAGANRTFNPATIPGLGCVAPLFCYEFTPAGDSFDTTSAPTNKRHGFLLSPPTLAGLPLTQKAQTQAATFIATGALP